VQVDLFLIKTVLQEALEVVQQQKTVIPEQGEQEIRLLPPQAKEIMEEIVPVVVLIPAAVEVVVVPVQ
jgi:hypothetical protein